MLIKLDQHWINWEWIKLENNLGDIIIDIVSILW